MCEPLMPIDALKSVPFSVASLAQLCGTPGSYERENAKNVARGIASNIAWIVAQLEAAGEGNKNMGAKS